MKNTLTSLTASAVMLAAAAGVLCPLTSTLEAGELLLAQAQTGAGDPIAPEPLGKIETLPAKYPDHWLIVQDAAFFHMSDGKFIIVDITADSTPEQFKAFFNGSKIAQFAQSSKRPEFYVAETFLSRGQRGERTDVLTILDATTAAPVGEVVIPPKRISQMPTQYAVQLTDGEDKALVLNFNPATSVTVVDLVNRQFLGEVPVPGCSSLYATGANGFSSLCADGTIYSVALNDDGSVKATARSDKFFDTDADAVFERAAMIGGTGYFPTFMGHVVPIDFSGDAAAPGERWSMLREGDEGWRPGGIQVAASDAAGRLYVLMHPEGYEGSHKDPGTEVWVFDVASQSRVQRIALNLPGLTFTVTQAEQPLLVTTNVELNLDVYHAGSGAHQRTLAGFGAETALALHPVR